MFTGIVEGMGKVLSLHTLEKLRSIIVEPLFVCNDLNIGDSIAVNGVCLTVSKKTQNSFFAEIVEETTLKTNFKNLEKNNLVNLERSLKIGNRIHGHFVSGHVDCTGEIIEINTIEGAYNIKIKTPFSFMPFIAKKGSITIDGMSITVVEVFDDQFSITLIPHTLKNTIANQYKTGTCVNLEVDMLAKYIKQLAGEK